MYSPQSIVNICLNLAGHHHIDLVELAAFTRNPFINFEFFGRDRHYFTSCENIFYSFCILEEGFESPLVLEKLFNDAEDLQFLFFERHISNFQKEGDWVVDGAKAVWELSWRHEIADEHLDDVGLALVEASRWNWEELLEGD
jgi:hypothetical protein